ncbi:DUF6114 domain-containing protein [Nocardioides sp. NBC_00368]|uniref:DUF6114 domain-containing protein n=1 Tax=Nocardioides sp. NBC_00368 TaxID=2976000 RepID=UPI002E234FB8
MTDSLTDDLGFSTDPRPGSAHRRNRLGAFLAASRSWFRAWRRTRPFWGALWLIVAGAWIIYWMSFDIGIALTGGWSYSAGYVMGGSLIMFGLVTWLAPHYKSLSGVVAFLIALGAFPTANLGGFVVGSVLGIIGGSMVWSWGEKKPRPARHVTSGG